jgi:hypothetical protein
MLNVPNWENIGKFSGKCVGKCRDVAISHRHQYSESNVMQLLFGLLRIKGLYMFRALLAHPQEMLHKRYLVYNNCRLCRCRYTTPSHLGL